MTYFTNNLTAEEERLRALGPDRVLIAEFAGDRPEIVCLCGSTRFPDAFREATLRETLAGRIVVSIGCNMRTDTEVFGAMSETDLREVKIRLDELHKRKIDLADRVQVLNVGGYVGDSTRSEIEYACSLGKPVSYLEPAAEQGDEVAR